ncbi:MAG: hypothetical protein AAFX00_06760, partial [Pseudomonadota bacterium]
WGGSGADTFDLMVGHGDDRIRDFETSEDFLRIRGVSADFDLESNATVEDGDLLVDIGSDTVRLDDVTDASAVEWYLT